MTDKAGPTADLVTGVVLFALAVATIAASLSMDRLEIRQIHPLTAPGLLPGLLGLALAVCSVVLIAQAVGARRRATPPDSAGAESGDPADSRLNLGLAALLCLGYALGLVGRLPFWLATAIFVTLFILLFEWPMAGTTRSRLVNLAWALAIGLAAGLGIANAFSEIFLVRLP